jgi:hypothetical protein
MLLAALGSVFAFQIFDQEANNRQDMMRGCGERGQVFTMEQAY